MPSEGEVPPAPRASRASARLDLAGAASISEKEIGMTPYLTRKVCMASCPVTYSM